VFLDCRAENALGPSGAAESWTSGVLCERVRVAGPGAGLLLTLDNTRAQGGGWTAANSVVWNCEAPRIEVRGPAGAENRVVRSAGPLYERQLAARGVSLPPRAATVCAGDDAAPLFEWASHAGVSAKPVACEARGMPPLEIVNGRFVIGGRAVWGGAVNAAWWRGQYTATNVPDSGVSITRFVPGRDGRGLTEVLEDTAARMAADGTPFYQAGPGLWYDRRRDDHRTVARPDANVWTPFYEMPWARSGCGVAWDGLSKYDLAKYNPWYFSRTKTFAALCRAYGLVLHNNFYNTHNFLETLAHWVDCPLRPANNINDTGLPEPPPVDAGNTIHVATSVYSVADPRLRALHRAYIRHQLDTFEDETNVIHTLAFQFAGPLAFQEFFLDEVAAWQREKPGRRARVALVTSKDVTDAILARLERARLVDVIDMRYWQTLADGTPWAPHGEGTLAFREQNWLTYKRSGDTPAASASLFVYRQVREYRDRCPGKAIVAWHGGAGAMPVLMAGGAQALMRNPAAGQSQGDIDRTPLDVFVRKHLAADLARLNPRDHWFADPERVWCLADDAGRTLLVSALPSADIIPLSERMQTATWDALWFNPSTGGTQVEQGLVLKTGVPVKTNTHAGAEQTAWMLLLRAK
jgi:hypothetical protein